MPKTMTATELRANLYRVLDEVAATGKPCRVVRGGHALVIGREPARRKKRRDLSKLKRRDGLLNCTFDELVATTWPYKPDPNL
jgi:hypothetical protein